MFYFVQLSPGVGPAQRGMPASKARFLKQYQSS